MHTYYWRLSMSYPLLRWGEFFLQLEVMRIAFCCGGAASIVLPSRALFSTLACAIFTCLFAPAPVIGELHCVLSVRLPNAV